MFLGMQKPKIIRILNRDYKKKSPGLHPYLFHPTITECNPTLQKEEFPKRYHLLILMSYAVELVLIEKHPS
jgi:hypothetical protein